MIIASGETGAFNVGRDDDEVPMSYIAIEACRITGASTDLIQYVDPPAKKTMVKRLSTARLYRLGWQPTVGLEDGMRMVYDWIKNFPWIE